MSNVPIEARPITWTGRWQVIVTEAELATPLRRANVVVVLNASDHDHFAVSGEVRFRRACPPMGRADIRRRPRHSGEVGRTSQVDGNVDAVVFASNSLITTAAQRAVAHEDFIRHWAEDGPNSDVGVVLLHQFLRPNAALTFDFLGSAAFSLVGEPPRRLERGNIRFESDWLFTEETPNQELAEHFLALSVGYGKQKHGLWTRSEPRYPAQWERLVWEHGREPLISTCNAGDRVVIASRVPIDLMGNTELLGSLIASSLRPRGCLLVEASGTSGSTAFTPALASAIERGRFVHRVSPGHPSEIDPARAPYHFFDELIVAPEWHVEEMVALDEPTVLRKLEQGGSLVVTFTGPGRNPVTVRLRDQPQYAVRANHFASLVPAAPGVLPGRPLGDARTRRGGSRDACGIRGRAVDSAGAAQRLRSPPRRRCPGRSRAPRQRGRQRAGDGREPTLRCGAGRSKPRWPAGMGGGHLDREPTSAVAQALILVPELRTDERLQRCARGRQRSTRADDDERLLDAYAAVLFATSEPGLLRSAAGDPSLGLGVQAELLRAMVRTRVQATDEIVGLAALVRERIDRLAGAEGGLEAVCIGNAALIELARRQGIGPTIGVRGRPRELDARTIENTELVRKREEAVRDSERYRHVGRQATTLLVALLILMTVAAVAAIFVWSDGGLGNKFGFASGVLSLMSGVVGYVVAKAREAGLPPWPTI